MEPLAALTIFWTAFTLALVSPGPNFAVILGTAMRAGRPAALRVAGGMVMGEAVWGVAAVFGVAALVTQHAALELVLRLGGGAFLLYLAFISLRSAWRGHGAAAMMARAENSAEAGGAEGGVARGFLLMLLNPKAGFFWVSLSSVLLVGQGAGWLALAVAGAVLISALWHSLLAYALTARRVLRGYAAVRRWLDAVLGFVLAGLGLRLIAGE